MKFHKGRFLLTVVIIGFMAAASRDANSWWQSLAYYIACALIGCQSNMVTSDE